MKKQKQHSLTERAALVKRLLSPGGPTLTALSLETGISKQSLSKWRKDAHKLPLMASEDEEGKVVPMPRTWTVEDKGRIVAEAGGLSGEELGAYLRREGVHPEQLAMWRRALADGYDQDKANKRYIMRLEKEIRRKDKALAEAAAIALLKKKLSAVLGEEDDDTDDSSGS